MTWLAASLELTDGRIVRIGDDEAETENQPESFSFDTSNPGGFGSASIRLPRPENLFADDAKLFSAVTVYGELGTAYEGLVVGVPQVDADFIELQLAGWVTVLDRHETFQELYVNRDLSAWGEPGNSNRQYWANNGYTFTGGPGIEASDSAEPVLVLSASQDTVNPAAEAWYKVGPGARVESIYYEMTSISTADYTGIIGASDDWSGTNVSNTADLLTGVDSSSTGTFSASLGDVSYGQFAFIQFYAGGGYATPGNDDRFMVKNLAVFGNHGLTKRGTAPNQGYYASDVIGHMVSQCASLTSSTDSIEQTAFVIQHLVFDTDTALRSAIEQVTALGGNQNVPNDWGVYEDREFYWRSPGTYGRVWHVRRDQVASSQSDGPDADRRVAGVKINYTDGAGTALSVGPPGSGADYETTDLLDTDPDNPAHRIPGAFKSESVGIIPDDPDGTPRGAVNVGVMILNERNRLDWRGSVEIQGEAEDANGNTFPAYLIRAGDRIVISDSDDPTERTIVSTSYDHGSMTTSAAIGAAPDSLESLLGQLAAVTDLVAT